MRKSSVDILSEKFLLDFKKANEIKKNKILSKTNLEYLKEDPVDFFKCIYTFGHTKAKCAKLIYNMDDKMIKKIHENSSVKSFNGTDSSHSKYQPNLKKIGKTRDLIALLDDEFSAVSKSRSSVASKSKSSLASKSRSSVASKK